MNNPYFPDDEITENDLYFVCYMIERIARTLHQRNAYVVNAIPKQDWIRLLGCASMLHCENPLAVEADWIEHYHLQRGEFDITDVDSELCQTIPSALSIGKVYTRLILDTMQMGEDYSDGLIRVYNAPICEVIDNYNGSAYYEPSYVIARAYNEGGF